MCSRTRACILSGQSAARHGITAPACHTPPRPHPSNPPITRYYFDPEQFTLAEALREAGYRTGHFGKWHLGLEKEHWPEAQGFDVAFYSDNGGNVHSNTGDNLRAMESKKLSPAYAEMLADWGKWAGDQPPTNNTPLRDGKGSLYEGGSRVPLMIRWPGEVRTSSAAPSSWSRSLSGFVILPPVRVCPVPTSFHKIELSEFLILAAAEIRRFVPSCREDDQPGMQFSRDFNACLSGKWSSSAGLTAIAARILPGPTDFRTGTSYETTGVYPLPSNWVVPLAWLFGGVLMPFFCFLIAYPEGPTWQSGQWQAYAQLLLARKPSLVQYPFLLYSMTCLVLLVYYPTRFWNNTFVRLGIFTGVLLAAEYWLAFQFAWLVL